MTMKHACVFAGTVAIASTLALAQNARFSYLTNPPFASDEPESVGHTIAYGISADGSRIVGSTDGANESWMIGLTWNSDGRANFSVGWFNGRGSSVRAASGDGSVAVGRIGVALFRPAAACLWRFPGSTEVRFQSPSSNGLAYGVSSDGMHIVGDSGNSRAVKWSPDGSFRDLAVPGFSSARAVSADGSRIVGVAGTTEYEWRAFAWTAAGGVQMLPGDADAPVTNAQAISADGLTIVGYSGSYDTGAWLTRWQIDPGTGAIAMMRLGGSTFSDCLAGFTPPAISADGMVIGGSIDGQAAIWTGAGGVVQIRDLASACGYDLSGVSLTEVTGISADHRTFVGNSVIQLADGEQINSGWIFTVPGPTSLSVLPLAVLWAGRRRRM